MISYKKFIKILIPWVVFAFIMNMSRFALTEIHSYLYMNWNLFLSFLPLLFLFVFEKSKKIYLRILFFIIWLLFLPNSIYMVSDLIHLRDVGPEWLLWFDGMMIFSYSVVGVFVSSYVLIRMKNILFSFRKNVRLQNLFIIIISILSSFGVYLGRYIRLNTWDIVANPISFMENIFNIIKTQSLNNIFIITIIFFSFLMLVGVFSLNNIFSKQKEEN